MSHTCLVRQLNDPSRMRLDLYSPFDNENEFQKGSMINYLCGRLYANEHSFRKTCMRIAQWLVQTLRPALRTTCLYFQVRCATKNRVGERVYRERIGGRLRIVARETINLDLSTIVHKWRKVIPPCDPHQMIQDHRHTEQS